MQKTIEFRSKFRSVHSITADLSCFLGESNINNGYCLVAAPSSSMGIAITSFWDPRGLDDLLDEIDRSFPTKVIYHSQHSPYDASGQVKSSVMGNRLLLPIHNGQFVLGHSQGIVVLDFDGPRQREISVSIKESCLITKTIKLKTEYLGVHSLLSELKKMIVELNINNALCHLSCTHSTAGIALTGLGDDAKRDQANMIEQLVPTRVDFKHRETASDAGGHVKTALFGSQLDIIIEDGKIILGDDEDISFMEYDGPRPRTVVVSFLGVNHE